MRKIEDRQKGKERKKKPQFFLKNTYTKYIRKNTYTIHNWSYLCLSLRTSAGNRPTSDEETEMFPGVSRSRLQWTDGARIPPFPVLVTSAQSSSGSSSESCATTPMKKFT